MNKKTIIMGIAIALYIPSSIICMDQPKITIHQYQSECEKILTQQKTKFENYKTTAIAKDLTQEKALLEKKLGLNWIHLKAKKQNFLSNIQKQFNIDEVMWQVCLKTIKDVEQFNTANQHLPLPNIVHDPTIPEDLLFPITVCLQKMNINPQRINIRGKTNKPYLYSFKPPMPYLYKLATACPKKGKNKIVPFIFSSEYIRSGKIIINLDMFKKISPGNLVALCLRMADNIAQDSTLCSEIVTMFEPLLTTQPGTIINSKLFKEFESFNIKQLPILLPCISDSTTTTCMLELQHDCFDPDFTSQDYKLLAKIDRYWKSLAWIEKQQQDGN